MSHPNADRITKFYTDFAAHDGAAMASFYGPASRFSDPVFPDLVGERIGAMWQMLTSRATELRLEFRDVKADDTSGSAHWEAWYPFSATGRQVHNVIEARFEFADGVVVSHRDEFDFWRWSGQALGMSGTLLGWTPIVRNKVRSGAAEQLEKWIAKQKKG